MKHNIIPKALRCLAAAGLCLAAAACSKDDIMPVEPPQEGITPTKIIFNVTRGGYEGDAETWSISGMRPKIVSAKMDGVKPPIPTGSG